MTTLQLTPNALTVLKTRYLLPGETPEALFWRVARAIAEAEAPGERERWANTFFDMMASTQFMPNSPTLFNAGTGQGTLSACFVIPIEDSMESIMKAATVSAMIQKYGGGIGYSFSKLRPKASHISTTHGKACGAVAVLKMLSALSDMITQGGKRHGANMGILHVSHPEILDFIHMKDDDVTAQNFNISVAVTDAFMEAVEKDQEWALVVPPESGAQNAGQVVKRLPARQIWKEIVESAWKTGDPGLYFIDEANRHNPTPHLGNLDSTNPCGEVPLLGFEACNLGSINLAKFVRDPYKPGQAHIDWTSLEEMTRKAVRFLDNVITVNKFPTPEVQEAVSKTRKIGLGVMGWHDALVLLGIPYDSQEALDMADRLMGTINDVARETSVELAKERGPYPACREAVPIRNSTRTCIAPTGSISAIAGCSSGIEPIFAVAFVKNVLDGKQLTEVNPYFVDIARHRGFYSQELMERVASTGSVQNEPEVPDDVKALFKTALEISYQTHVKMQAVFQKHTDLAVSKTINLPNSATVEDIDGAYKLAYQLKCKGITVYRDGSKSRQVLEVKRKKKEEETGVAPSAQVAAKPAGLLPRVRPAEVWGVTERIRTGHGNMYITINFDDRGRPFEVFTNLGKAGGCDSAQLEAISRLVSMALRAGVAPEEIVDQLKGITCCPAWDQGVLVRSAPDAVALALSRHLKGPSTSEAYAAHLPLFSQPEAQQQQPQGTVNGANGAASQTCPDCNTRLVFQEGCMLCPSCGWNKCA